MKNTSIPNFVDLAHAALFAAPPVDDGWTFERRPRSDRSATDDGWILASEPASVAETELEPERDIRWRLLWSWARG